MKTENKLNNLGKNRRVILQLARLETLTDVVYAIVIWRIFVLIPKPGEANWHWDSIGPFLTSNVLTFALIIIGLAITIIYWLQNNALFGNLERTDGLHTAISIIQLFLLLIFLFSIRLGVVLGASTATRAFESCAAALLGIASVSGWYYAKKNRRLLVSDFTEQDANALSDRIMAEPITAIITLPCAFIGPVVWEISWLSYLLVAAVLKRRRRGKNHS
ncbi:MAG: hypothetical protein PVI19_13745 [Syntrophobacterales bacterium]|jgi:uncharacterized membrane protein